MNIIRLIKKAYSPRLPSLSPCCPTTTFYRLPPLYGECEANEAAKIKSTLGSRIQESGRPRNSSIELASGSTKKLKTDSFTALAEDMLNKTRGRKKEPQKTADRTCLRRFATNVLETHDPEEAEGILADALSKLETLANDHKVKNPMAVFMSIYK